MKPAEIIAQYENMEQISDLVPGNEFSQLLERNSTRFKKIIMELKENDPNLQGIDLQIGMMSPLNAIICEEIKELCGIPFRREDGSLLACEGVVENWKGCPPHSPPVTESIEQINKATGFLIMQFDGIRNTEYQKYFHKFTLNVEEKLKGDGETVIQSYSCGPCRVCKKGCNDEGECRAPALRLFALEACGFWVNHLCRKAAEFPIYGDKSWEIQWVNDWNLPTQNPPAYKSVTGILLG